MTSPFYLLFLLIASIAFIVWSTAYKKMNAFFALLLAAFGVGLLSGLPIGELVEMLKKGFGSTMEKIGLLIILGTTLGIILEKTGATSSMANSILRRMTEKNAPAAIALTGFIMGFPIFCDSGFIILSGLNHSLVKKTHFKMPVMAAVLATSLYAVHCLVPPHPGITAAVGTAGGELGRVMLWGMLLAIPTVLIGYLWSVWRGNKMDHSEQDPNHVEHDNNDLPSPLLSFIPVVLPIMLIGLNAMLQLNYTTSEMSAGALLKIISFVGDPVMALGIAVVVSTVLIKVKHKEDFKHWLTDGVDKAGMILAICAAGGMFGAMLKATGIGSNLGEMLSGLSLGIFFPFLIAATLKTAQGSTTVAVITAASLVTPLFTSLGLDSPMGITLAILSMGAGSMVISHANDSYFWVISRFSNMDTSTTLKVYSMATLIMGVSVQLIIWLLFLVLG
ncbi:GntP family permease [Fulvivirga sp.]|uniref:GntP family permease n=1 Tax=Fulvivirga sp. TaxID=1931237 RepID=UPI0032ECD10C